MSYCVEPIKLAYGGKVAWLDVLPKVVKNFVFGEWKYCDRQEQNIYSIDMDAMVSHIVFFLLLGLLYIGYRRWITPVCMAVPVNDTPRQYNIEHSQCSGHKIDVFQNNKLE